MQKELTGVKVAIATGAVWKVDALTPLLNQTVGEDNWGTIESMTAGFIRDKVIAHALCEHLINEPSADVRDIVGQRIPIVPGMDAMSKLIGAGFVLQAVMPSEQSYYEVTDKVEAHIKISIDAMSAWINPEQLAIIENAPNGDKRRQVIDALIRSDDGGLRIKFNGKATVESLDKNISEMQRACGLMVLAVVKGDSSIAGVEQYGQIPTKPVSRAFLFVGKIKDNDKPEIETQMRRNGVGISSGVKSQDLHKADLLESVYCGRLKGNGPKLQLALTGINLDDVEVVLNENLYNIADTCERLGIKQRLYRFNVFTKLGYALSRFGEMFENKKHVKVDKIC